MSWLALGLTLVAGQANIQATKHNLSAGATTNQVRAATEDQICIFCHTPHAAAQSRTVWNRSFTYQNGGSLYSLYGSTTIDAVPDRPNGASKLCLTCHDGALALGSVMNDEGVRPATIAMAGATTMPTGPRNLGTDLRNDHPVSLQPNLADPEIVLPPTNDAVQLKEGPSASRDTVQCTSCHDPHFNTTKFLVKSNARGAVCTTCHQKQGWLGSMHESSTALYPATGTTSVAERACLNCHKPHNGEGPTKLLTTQNLSGGAPLAWAEENVCFSCHKSGGTSTDVVTGRAAPNIESESLKAVRHPFSLKTDEHQPVFTAKSPAPEAVLNVVKHVECVDCHNPHQVKALPGNVHEGMKGISLSGAVVVDDAANDLKQYEVCFRCHGDSFATFIPPAPTRPPSGSNKRLEFQTTNDAFHPVAGPGKNQSTYLNNVLDTPGGQLHGNDYTGARLNRFSTVLCTDCHNNNATADTQGSARNSPSGPKGPHGSTNTRMLRANYSTATGTNSAPFGSYNTNNFALCFLCHDEARLRGNYSNFYQAGGIGAGRGNLHQVHLVDRTNASCHECHNNVHSNVAATNTDYRNVPPGTPTHLVNFAPTVSAGGGTDPQAGDRPTLPRWGRTNGGDYYCYASCHGRTAAMDGSKSVYRPPNP